MNKLLIKNIDFIATLNSKGDIHTGQDIYIEENKIKEIGFNLKHEAEIIQGYGRIAIPGLVNTHHHLYQTLTRCNPSAQNAKLFNWLITLYEIWRKLTPEAVYISALVGLGELLLTGCTTSTDMFYVFPKKFKDELFDHLVRAGADIGIRFVPCRGSMSRGKSQGGLPPDDLTQTEDEILCDSERVIKKYHNSDPFSMCRVALGPCSPFSVTPFLLEKTRDLARKYKVRLHTHLAETKDEESYCLQIYKKAPFEFMESLGWLGEDVWYAHGVYLKPEEIKKMAMTKTGLAHCPSSNMRLGSGIAPVYEMYNAGVPVGIAVDGSSSNDTSDMLGELRMALLLSKLKSPEALCAYDILKMGTTGGAEILGLSESIGTIQTGKAADIVLINLNKLGFAGAMQNDPVASLIFCGDSHIVDTSIVNGEIVVKDGRLTRINEEEIIKKANNISKEIS